MAAVLVGSANAADSRMLPEAKARLDRGVQLYTSQSYREAIEEFRAGYQIDPRPEFLYAMAQAQRLNGDCRSAVTAYKAFLRTRPSAKRAAAANQLIDDCTAALAKESLRAAPPDPERDGTRADGTRADGTRPDGTRPDGTRADGTRADGTRADGTRADGTRADGTRADGTRADGTRADGTRSSAGPAVSVAPRAFRVAPLVIGASSVAMIVSGAIVRFTAQTTFAQLSSTCRPVCDPTATAQIQPREITGNLLLGIGAAALAIDLVWWWLTRDLYPPPVAPQGLGAEVRF